MAVFVIDASDSCVPDGSEAQGDRSVA